MPAGGEEWFALAELGGAEGIGAAGVGAVAGEGLAAGAAGLGSAAAFEQAAGFSGAGGWGEAAAGAGGFEGASAWNYGPEGGPLAPGQATVGDAVGQGALQLGTPATSFSNWISGGMKAMSPYMPMLKTAGSLTNLGTSVYGMYQGDQLQRKAAGMRDPYAVQRGQYASQLNALNSNPGQVLPTLPGYQAGLDAVQRSMAAQGYTGSGNMMTALQQYGGNAFQQESARLSQLSGMSQPPDNAAQAQMLGGGLNLQLNSLGLAGKTLSAMGS